MEPSDRFPITLGEAMYSLRAIRRVKPDPIPDDDLRDILDAARQAPNGGNAQPWHFLAIKDEQLRWQFGELYREAWWAKRADQGIHGPADIDPENKTTLSAMKLSDEIGAAPVIVLLCATAQGAGAMGSVIPSVQNMLLAARALGIGGTITTLHAKVDDRVKELLAIPEEMQIVYAIPLGYPQGHFGSVTRKPLAEIASVDRWGNSIG
jgi:nitroreductase